MQAHGRFAQEPWTYDARDARRSTARYVLLHERLVPYVRAAAATAARCGLPIVRPLLLIDPADARGWTIADAYGYGPALWVAPVLEDGRARARGAAAARRLDRLLDAASDVAAAASVRGAGAAATAIPVCVRAGSIVVTYPAEHVAAGLGDRPRRERPLEATLWGEPPLGRTRRAAGRRHPHALARRRVERDARARRDLRSA